MKKYLLLIAILSVLACKSKKDSDNTNTEDPVVQSDEVQEVDTKDEENEVVNTSTNPKADKDILDPKKGVIVVLKKDANITETEKLIKEKGLTIDKDWISDKQSLKYGFIKVPAQDKDKWLKKLIELGMFSEVKLYSEKNLDKIIQERTK